MDICSPRAQCTSANPSSSIEAHPPSSAIRENGPNRLRKLSRRPGRRIPAAASNQNRHKVLNSRRAGRRRRATRRGRTTVSNVSHKITPIKTTPTTPTTGSIIPTLLISPHPYACPTIVPHSMTLVLSHTLVASNGHTPQRWLVILHGAFGAGRNWGTIARHWPQARPEGGVVLADLRMPGASQGFPPPHTLEAAAADIDALGRSLGFPLDAVLGHSLGGKIALLYTARHAAALRQMWVVDSTPAAGPPSGSAWEMLRAVRSLPAQFTSRQEAAEGLTQLGFASDVARWMTMNLESSEGRYRWRLDFDALEELLCDFFQTDLWSAVLDPPAGVELHFIKASHSDVLSKEALRRLDGVAATHRASLDVVPGGHWIQADNPEEVVRLLARHLP